MFKPGTYVTDNSSAYQHVHRVIRQDGEWLLCRSVGRPHAGGLVYDTLPFETCRDPKKLSEYQGGFARR